jgi:alpha-galactosidase
MLSAPLLIGCDISKIDDFTYNLLANSEVIAIDQDPLGKAAMPVIKEKDYQIWVKQLADGSKVLGLFNLNENERPITVNLSALGFTGKLKLRDVWRQKDNGRYDGSGSFTTNVYGHGAVLIKVMNSEQ